MTPIERFTTAYVEAIYFTECGPDSDHAPDASLTPLALADARNECARFFEACKDLIPVGRIAQAGHDFWLTRNGHGAGFWDRPELYGEDAAATLTRVSEAIGETWPDFDG